MTTEPLPFDACPECKGKGSVQVMDWEMPVGYEPCDCIRRRATVPADIAQAAADEFHRVHEQDGTTWGDAIESALQVAFAMLPEQSVWVERVDPTPPEFITAVDRVLDFAGCISDELTDSMRYGQAPYIKEPFVRGFKVQVEHLREVRRDLSTAPAVEGVTVIDGRVFEVRPIAGVGDNGSNCAFLRPVKEAS